MVTMADLAVVLRRLDYSETSQIIVLFTRQHGKVRAIGKGLKRSTKKRFAVGIDLLDLGGVVLSARQERSEGLATLTEWSPGRYPGGLREKLCRIHGGQYAAEITAELTEDWDPHVAVYDGLVAVLHELAEANGPHSSLVRYQRRLLEGIGSFPRFDACVLCGRTTDMTHFSSFEGGMVCQTCNPRQAEKHAVSPQTWSGLNQGSEPESWLGPFSLLNYHISHLMGREPVLAPKLKSRPR